jgi:hypothetical protein
MTGYLSALTGQGYSVTMVPAQPTLVRQVALDFANDGSLDLAGAAGYDEVVISVANVSPTGSVTRSHTGDIPLVLFADGFETGETSAWSQAAP